MADYVVKGESLTAVADAIRAKTGETDALGLDEMPGKVGDVFEAGKKSEHDAFWDAYQQNGERKVYDYAFYNPGWTDANFYPKYDIKPTNATSMFQQTGIKDLAGRLKECGVTLDFSEARIYMAFYNQAELTHIPVVDTRAARNTDLYYLFGGSTKIESIEKIILRDDGSQTFNGTFSGNVLLKEVRFEGVIGQKISFSNSIKLTHDSLMSIINALKDYAGSGTTYTCTLGSTNLAKLTDAEKQIATGKGWTLA